MKNTDYPIDFVIYWIDGNDPEWLAEKAKYSPTEAISDDRDLRYRDWENLQYIFRGIEKFAPWVNNIHLVTWGHLPKWLNINAPKLKIVLNDDFIPSEYSPTFSSHPKELNMHRIPGLSEHFVYFNDDMFILKKTKPDDFFKDGKPCDCAILTAHSHNEAEPYMFMQYRATGMVNKYFNMRDVIKNNRRNWFNLKYGKMNFRSWVLSGLPRFPGFWQQHLPYSLLKSTLEELWEKEYDNLHQTCLNRFRSMSDFNIWVFRNWQLAAGNFYPRSIKTGKSFVLNNDASFSQIAEYIFNQTGKMICINDADLSWDEFQKYKADLINVFDEILPDKSEYEL
ncbi:MAG: Stealth CR1 domain-containing protein [Lachnospiraceae bacterium]|nr:Stealth CR1 domain-containing protein [Lachnospiraceae bacterium]